MTGSSLDGILYPSYYSELKEGNIDKPYNYGLFNPSKAKERYLKNIALFGYPIKENRIIVKSINRIYLTQVKYELNYGPVFSIPSVEEADNMFERVTKELDDPFILEHYRKQKKERQFKEIEKNFGAGI